MRMQVYEGQRVSVSSEVEKVVVSWSESHAGAPIVSATVEPRAMMAWSKGGVNIFFSNVDTTGATIHFSSPFSGYLHVHAFSTI